MSQTEIGRIPARKKWKQRQRLGESKKKETDRQTDRQRHPISNGERETERQQRRTDRKHR